MGYAIAKAASRRGATVTLVSGVVDLPKPSYVNVVDIVSAQDMYDAVIAGAEELALCLDILEADRIAQDLHFRQRDARLERIDLTGVLQRPLHVQ